MKCFIIACSVVFLVIFFDYNGKQITRNEIQKAVLHIWLYIAVFISIYKICGGGSNWLIKNESTTVYRELLEEGVAEELPLITDEVGI